MKNAITSFVAIYALIIGAASCSSTNSSTPAGGGGGSTTQYVQVERLARPAIKEAFQAFENHDGTNRINPYATPYSSQTLYKEIGSFTTTVAGRTSNGLNNGTDVPSLLQALLIPDEMSADLSQNTTTAGYLGVETKGAGGAISLFGGRALTDDVISTSLDAIFGPLLTKAPGGLGLVADDGKESPCLETDNVIGTNGPYINATAVATAKHISTTFPYVGTPY
jgi:hypothetical protein